MSNCNNSNYTSTIMSRPPVCTAMSTRLSVVNSSPEITFPPNFIPPSSAKIIVNNHPLPESHSVKLALSQPEIPDEWDWRGKADIQSPRNQGGCGSCWAFANTAALSDRFAIKHKVSNPNLSPAYLMSCANSKNWSQWSFNPLYTCDCGGDAVSAGNFLYNNGCKTEDCWPYGSTAGGQPYITDCIDNLTGCCKDCCQQKQDKNKYWSLFKAGGQAQWLARCEQSNQGSLDVSNTIADIQRNIMEYGPVVCSFFVLDDFENWWNNGAPGIYSPKLSGSQIQGGHLVSLVGWGKEQNTRFWWLRNSWGNTGYQGTGYCKVIFSDEISENDRVGYDVPIWYQWGSNPTAYIHGCYSIEAGDNLPMDLPAHTVEKHPQPLAVKPTNKYLLYIGIVVVVLLSILIITAVIE